MKNNKLLITKPTVDNPPHKENMLKGKGIKIPHKENLISKPKRDK